MGSPLALPNGAIAASIVLTKDGSDDLVFDTAVPTYAYTLAADGTLQNPTAAMMQPGRTGRILFTQPAGATYTLSFGAYWVFAGGSAVALTATVDAVDLLVWEVLTPTTILATLIADIQ